MTNGLVPGMVSLRHMPWRDVLTLGTLETLYEGPQVTRGIAQELVDRLIDHKAAWGRTGEATVRVMFDQELAKVVIDEMVREAGADILYQSEVQAVETENSTVKSVTLGDGTQIACGVAVDTTGDGDLCYLAGAEFAIGEPGDRHYVQPMSFYFLIGDVDMEAVLDGMDRYPHDFSEQYRDAIRANFARGEPFTVVGFPSIVSEAKKAGVYPVGYGGAREGGKAFPGLYRPIYRNGRMRYDVTAHNADMAYKVDATDASELSGAMSAMRRVAADFAEFFREHIPGYGDSYLLQVAEQAGVRESRRVIGLHVLTGEEVVEAAEFSDSVGYCGATVDVHDVDGGKKPTYMRAISKSGAYQVPYRILVPKSTDGLLVAGRCVSTDRIAMGSIRQQAGCMVTGQAAGTAAAIAVAGRVRPREVDIAAVQSALAKSGVVV